ncbi:type II toxin-antitoxin system prevent-host-death family antitoxin [Thioalkalivibrio sp. XN8]|nr:type II toxin-antitoxin system prevent-host-death family antitoxin [Thioalkalivibrio sp. XN8]
MKVNMHEAKSQLSRLAELVEQGQTIVIARAGKPCMDLVPHRPGRGPREPGRLKGRITIAPDFDATPAAVLEDFEQD